LILALATTLRGVRHPALKAFTGFLLASLLLNLFLGGELLHWLARSGLPLSHLGGHLIAATGITALWLTRSLFQTRHQSRRLDRLLVATMLAFALTSAAQLLLAPPLFACQIGLGLATAMIMITTGIVFWRRRHPAGRLYALAVVG